MKKLEKFSANEQNPKWKNMIQREIPLYHRNNDVRSEFERDYTRVVHSTAYRRLKHKTQVFFSPENDHICTRSEHVTHVESISYTIANYLGLNTELTKAIATAHDIGHSPFGHQGEKILSQISQRDIGEKFWHERHGMIMVDKVELLENPSKERCNLDLTYAVRDGIISHCGEIDENMLRPRDEFINLYEYNYPNEYAPYTWEGCVVKISDKISYLGRDIIDAVTLGILDKNNQEIESNTVIINDLIYDFGGVIISRLKVLRFYQTLISSPEIEPSYDVLLYVITKLSMLDEEEMNIIISSLKSLKIDENISNENRRILQ